MNAWPLLGALFVLGAVMFTVGVAGVLIARLVRKHVDAVDAAFDQAAALVLDGSHDLFDMTQDERDAEVRWLNERYGPPISPGRDS